MTTDLPCDRCHFVPTPDGKCICREVVTCWRSECRNGCYYPDVCSEAKR